VIAMLVLHEMDDSTRMGSLDEMKRVLKPNGRILLIDFHPGPLQPLQGWIILGFRYHGLHPWFFTLFPFGEFQLTPEL